MNSSNLSQLELENIHLRRAVAELSVLNEITTAIVSAKTLNEIVDLIMKKCVKHLKVEQAAVMLLDAKQADHPFHTLLRQADTSHDNLPYQLDTQLTGWMLKNQVPLLINDFAHDPRFRNAVDENFPIHSLLAVPLLVKGNMLGLIVLFNKKDEPDFRSEDQRLLSIIAAQSAQIIENARLSELEQELRNIQHEMKLAQDIQINLLPKQQPHLNDYDIAGQSIPAQEVGGDYFDFIAIDESRLAICLGDVSGKGISAAMLMANLQATIRSQTLLNLAPKDCLRHANKLLYESTDRQKFATLLFGILDSREHEFCFSNAGHNRPIFFQTGQPATTLKSSGLALSLLENVNYDEIRVSFNPGDVLLIYSDGITEAMNANHEEFGEAKLTELVQQNPELAAGTLIDKIIQAVQQHTVLQPQSDDMTISIIKRKKV